MTVLPTGSRGRWVALGLLVILLVAIYQFTLAPLWARYLSLAPQISEAQEQLARYQRLAAARSALQANATALQDDARFDDYLVPGASSALATAALQQRLQDLAQNQQARVLSTRVGKPVLDGDFETVTLNARLQTDLAGLQALLYQLETQPPYLFVRNLHVYRQLGRRAAADAGQLEVQLDIDGLRLAGDDTNE